jgi:uncharacterized protein YjiS (DUF1127 family)
MSANPTVSSSNRVSFAPSTPFQSAIVAAVTPVVDLLATWRQRAVDRGQLQELDDQLLRDIGLSRGDVEIEIIKPFWRG